MNTYTKKEHPLLDALYGIRRRPTLPGRVQPSTIGAEGLNFCVRNGNRWDPFAIATGNCNVFCFRVIARPSQSSRWFADAPIARFAGFVRFASSATGGAKLPNPDNCTLWRKKADLVVLFCSIDHQF